MHTRKLASRETVQGSHSMNGLTPFLIFISALPFFLKTSKKNFTSVFVVFGYFAGRRGAIVVCGVQGVIYEVQGMISGVCVCGGGGG